MAYIKKTRLVQFYDQWGNQAGLYSVPQEVTEDHFKQEYYRFDDPTDFDEDNLIGVRRVFIEEEIHLQLELQTQN